MGRVGVWRHAAACAVMAGVVARENADCGWEGNADYNAARNIL
jgi:hypothetical protein